MHAPAQEFTVIDADRHVIEPIDLWAQHLPEHLRARGPRLVAEVPEPLEQRIARLGPDALEPIPPRLFVDGLSAQRGFEEPARLAIARQSYPRLHHLRAGTRPDLQLQSMNESGIRAAFLLPTHGLFLSCIDGMDPELSAALCTAYNNWIWTYAQAEPSRLLPFATLPRYNPADTIRELHRVAEMGFPGVTLRPNPVGGAPVGHSTWNELWAELERLNLPVAFHEGSHARTPTVGQDRFSTRFGQHACSHPMEAAMAFLSLLEGGVLERHPNLRIAFLEAGAGWLTSWLWRLDRVEWAQLSSEVRGRINMAPSAYFRRSCWITVEADEPGLSLLADSIGPDRLLFGSDFPHLDHDADALDQIRGGSTGLAPQHLEGLLGQNSLAFLGRIPA